MGHHHHHTLNERATQAAVVIAAILVGGKAVAWSLTHSLSIQASLIDSLLDIGASLINFFAVKHAARPADEEHRFGHGKLEALAALLQSIFIAISAIWLIMEGVHRFYEPTPVHAHPFGTVVMILALLLTGALVLFQRSVYKKTKSIAIKADSLHYKTDFLTNAGVLISLHLTVALKIPVIDSLIGIGIAIYIGMTSWGIFKHAFDELMDRALLPKTVADIEKRVRSHPEVLGLHNLRTRSSGYVQFIQMDLELDPTLSLLSSHRIAHEVMHHLKKDYPQAEIIIHQDPFGFEERED